MQNQKQQLNSHNIQQNQLIDINNKSHNRNAQNEQLNSSKKQQLKRKHSIEAEKLNVLNNIEDFQRKPFQRLINDDDLAHYKESQPQRVHSALDYNKEDQIRHRRVQSYAFHDRTPSKIHNQSNTISKQSSVNPEVKFISQRVNEAISAFDKYKNSHLKRLDTVRQSLKKHTKIIDTNEHVEHEVQLLKRVRQMTQKSYHTRIKTGGSLIDFTIIKAPNPNDFLQVARPGDDNSSQEEVQEKFKQYFVHKPKYPLKIQSIRSSSRVSQRKICISEQNTKKNHITNPQINMNESLPQSQQITKRNNLVHKKKLIDVQKLKFNSSQDEQNLKRIEIKSLIYSLPVILAKNSHDKESIDYIFFKGTNFLYNHEYLKAIDIFSQAEFQTRNTTQFQKEMNEFNKAYCLYKEERLNEAIRIFEYISFYQLQILSKFNLAIMMFLQDDYEKAFEHLDYCIQQFMLGFMKIDWIHFDDFKRKCRKVYLQVSQCLRDLYLKNESNELNEKMIKKLESYDVYFQQLLSKNKDTQVQATVRTVAQLRTASVTNMAPSGSTSSLAPTINLNKQRSISMTSEYDLFTSTNNSPKTRLNKFGIKDFQIKPHQQDNDENKNKEYFPMPFEQNKRLVTSGSQEIRHRLKIQQIREKQRNQKLLNKLIRPQTGMDQMKNKSLNSSMAYDDHLDQKIQEVSFMSQGNLEKLVYKQYDKQSQIQSEMYNTQDQRNFSQHYQNYRSKNQFNLLQKFRKQKTSTLADDQQQQDIHKGSISMDLLDEEIKAYQEQQINFNKQEQAYSEISQSQFDYDELGLPHVKPLYLDKDNDITMDRILGIKKGEEMNEKEKEQVEKISKIEKEYMIEKVLENIQKEDSHDEQQIINKNNSGSGTPYQDELQKRNQDFIMENFFKIYDRTPNTKGTQSPVNQKLQQQIKQQQQQDQQPQQNQQSNQNSSLALNQQNTSQISTFKQQHQKQKQEKNHKSNFDTNKYNNMYNHHQQQLQQSQRNLHTQNHSTNQSFRQNNNNKQQSITFNSSKSNINQNTSQQSLYENESQHNSSCSEDENEQNQPFKNRLRLSEVLEVQEFINKRLRNNSFKVSITEQNDDTNNNSKHYLSLQHINTSFASNTNNNSLVNNIRNNDYMQQYKIIDKYLKRLSFFAKYPFSIRSQLISECILKQVESGQRLFTQGDSSKEFYVVLRGSTKAILIKKDYGNIPIVINTFYDGKEFGEVNLYEESETLNAEMVKQLNRQKYTCESMEDSFIICLDKEKTNKIINANLQANFEKRIEFLKQIEIFKGIEMHVLLPLANNLITEKYRLGEYILKEGQQPKGLYLLYKGQCKVGSEKLNMRSKTPFQFGNKLKKQMRNFKFKGNFHDMEHKLNFDSANGKERIDTRETNSNEQVQAIKPFREDDTKKLRSEKRVFQNDRIYFDENGKRIKDHIVYKDYMVFFTLTVKDYFGGRVLLVGDSHHHPQSQKSYYFETKDGEDDDEEVNVYQQQSQQQLFLGHQKGDETNSYLSVIADSSEVELLIMDRTQLSFFQEKVQKEIYSRIESAFQPDQPYEGGVVEKIKDKFREWEKYKLETVNSILKQSYAERKKTSILNINR